MSPWGIAIRVWGAIAKKAGIETSLMQAGDMVGFVNTLKTQLAFLGPNGVLVYLKPGRRIHKVDLDALPKAFEGTAFRYTTQLKKFLEDHLKN